MCLYIVHPTTSLFSSLFAKLKNFVCVFSNYMCVCVCVPTTCVTSYCTTRKVNSSDPLSLSLSLSLSQRRGMKILPSRKTGKERQDMSDNSLSIFLISDDRCRRELPCGANAVCKNLPNRAYQCTCYMGYKMDSMGRCVHTGKCLF